MHTYLGLLCWADLFKPAVLCCADLFKPAVLCCVDLFRPVLCCADLFTGNGGQIAVGVVLVILLPLGFLLASGFFIWRYLYHPRSHQRRAAFILLENPDEPMVCCLGLLLLLLLLLLLPAACYISVPCFKSDRSHLMYLGHSK